MMVAQFQRSVKRRKTCCYKLYKRFRSFNGSDCFRTIEAFVSING